MSETASSLLGQLLALPEGERFLIADQLWESLSDENKEELCEECLEDNEFQAELQHRLESVSDGTAGLIDGEAVFQEARERLSRRRQQ